jgi:hypothetical protein
MVLSALTAVVYLADALVTMFAIGNSAFIANLKSAGAPQWVIDNVGTILAVETVLLFAITVVYFMLYVGFQHGNRWAWGLSIGFSIFGIAFTILEFFAFPGIRASWQAILEILIPALILAYITRPSVKHFFIGSSGETETPDLED